MLNRNSILKTALVLLLLAVIVSGCTKTENDATQQNREKSVKIEVKGTSYKISTSESVIDWTGRKVAGSHYGTVNLANGELFMDNGKLTGGSFEADMTSLKILDITDAEMNAKLTGHLKSDDFFSVEKSANAKLEITGIKPGSGADKYEVSANLTIKGITKPITFPAHIISSGNKLTAEASLDVDRTLYDMKFRSGKFFENLGDKLISDIFSLKVKLSANS
jgi:polyisoprenoid-binding protein YceI